MKMILILLVILTIVFMLFLVMVSLPEDQEELEELEDLYSVKPSPAINAGGSTAQKTEMKKQNKLSLKTEESPRILGKARSLTVKDPEKELFDLIVEKTGSDILAATMLGNAHRESRMKAYRWESDIYPDENGEYPISKKNTEQINELLRAKNYKEATRLFVSMNPFNNWAGFGLYGFTAMGHKANLIKFCILNDYLIDDPKAQTLYVLFYISDHHPDLYADLVSETDLYSCVSLFKNDFEKCETSETGLYDRQKWAKYYYELYGGAE